MNNQPRTKQDLSIDGIKKPFPIAETFYSIQGEGMLNGFPAFFIRFSGCNNCCYFCDTDYTSGQEKAFISTLITKAKSSGTDLVVLTGGEPFLYDISGLALKLMENGFHVQLETAGTLSVPNFPFDEVTLNCSPKTGKINEEIANHADAFRYTIRCGEESRIDGLPIFSTQIEGKGETTIARPPHQANATVEVSPMAENDPDLYRRNLVACIKIAKQHGYRVNLQQHKIMEIR